MIDDSKNIFIHNDLKQIYGMNEKFIAETEITELLRNSNIYSSAKSHLNSKNTLRVPNVLVHANLKLKVPLMVDEDFFKFQDTPPTINDKPDKEYLEAKYKYEDSSDISSSISAEPSSSSSLSSESSSLSSEFSSLSSELQEKKIFTPKDIYMLKRKKKRGTPIFSTSNNFRL